MKTLKSLITELKRLRTVSITDPEKAHSQADDALIAYIDDPDVTRAFNNIDKWYA